MKRFLIYTICFSLLMGLFGLPANAADYSTPNVALGKPAYASSQYGGPHTTATVNDGNVQTCWAPGGENLMGKADGYDYIMIDLEAQYTVEAVVARSRRDMDQPGSRVGWVIQLSNSADFGDFITIGSKMSEGSFGSDLTIENINSEDSYRYVRAASKGAIVISEIEVYGKKFDPNIIPDFSDVTRTKDEIPANVVRSLKIMEGISRTVFGKNMAVTRAEACEIVAKFATLQPFGNASDVFEDVIGETVGYEYIYTCLNAGIVAKNEKFYPKEYITVTDFMKMILAAMGYMPQIETIGMAMTASNINLTFPKGKSANSLLSRADAAQIIYKALKFPVYRITSVSKGETTMEKQESFIKAVFDKEILEGAVTANSYTGFYEPHDKRKSYICIDGEEYTDSKGELGLLLGKNIVFIADDDKEIFAGWENKAKNETAELLRKDVEETAKNSITVSADGKSRRWRFSEDTAVLKNHVAYPNWKYSDFKGDLGKLEVTDNNGDGIIDVINIYDPKIVIAEYCDFDGDEFNMGGLNNTSVHIEKIKTLNVYKDGEKTDSGSIAKNGAAYIYASGDGRLVNIDYSFNNIKGAAESGNDDGCVIDGIEYTYSDYFVKYGEKITLGVDYTFILNDDNEIMWIVKNSDLKEKESRGFIQKVYADEIKNETTFRIFDESGSFLTFKAADKVVADGKRYGNLAAFVNSDTDYFKYKFVQYRLDGEGRINQLDTENYNASAEEDSRMIKSNVKASGGNIIFDEGIYSQQKMIMPVSKETMAFSIPVVHGNFVDDEVYDKYYSAGVMTEIFAYAGTLNANCEFYGADEFGYPYFVVKTPEYPEMTSSEAMAITKRDAPGMVLHKISAGVDSEGLECAILSGYNILTGEYESIRCASELKVFYDTYKMQQTHSGWFDSEYLFSIADTNGEALGEYIADIRSAVCGDVFRYDIEDGEAVTLERVFDYGRGIIDSYDSATKGFYSTGEHYAWPRADFRLVYGKILSVKDGKLKMSAANDSTEIFGYTNIPKVFFCDGEKISEKTTGLLPMYAEENIRLLLLTSNAKNRTIVVYRY